MQNRSQQTRLRILNAALVIFARDGYDASSVNEICVEAGVSKGAFFHHFPSKEAIFDVLILEKHPYKQIIPILQATPGDTIEIFIRNAARSIIAALDHRPDFLKLIFIEIIEFKGSHIPLLTEAVYPLVAPMLEHFNMPDNRLQEIPLPTILRSFIGLIFSYYIVQYMTKNANIPELKDHDDVDQFVDIFLHGILKAEKA